MNAMIFGHVWGAEDYHNCLQNVIQSAEERYPTK